MLIWLTNRASRSNSWSKRVFWVVEVKVSLAACSLFFLALFQHKWLNLHLSSCEVMLLLQLPLCSPKPLILLLLESSLPLPSLKCTFGGTSLDPKRLEEGETPPKKHPKYSPLKCGFLCPPVYITGCLGKCEVAHKSHWDVLNSPRSWMCSKCRAWDAISVYLYTSFQWQHLWVCVRWGETFSASHPDLTTLSLAPARVVSLRKAVLPSTQLRDEDIQLLWAGDWLADWLGVRWQRIWEPSRTVSWMLDSAVSWYWKF